MSERDRLIGDVKDAVLDNLRGRSGFDAMFEGLDDDIEEGLENSVEELVDGVLRDYGFTERMFKRGHTQFVFDGKIEEEDWAGLIEIDHSIPEDLNRVAVLVNGMFQIPENFERTSDGNIRIDPDYEFEGELYYRIQFNRRAISRDLDQ